MRIDTNKRVLDIYLDTNPITAIYIGTELYYERQTGAIAYTLVGGDGTYYIVIGEGSEPNPIVNIPNEHRNKPVKEIAQSAFSGKEITSLTIPENITSIKNNAFKNCYKLSSIYFNAKNCQDNEYSTKDAFYNVGRDTKTDITFGTNVEKIPRYMFRYNNYIKKVDLSGSSKLKEIPNYAFESCTSLYTTTFSNSIEKIGDGAFENTNLSSIALPTNLKEVGEVAFKGTNLSSITIPSNVTAIGNNAFSTCSDVTYDGDAQNFIDLIGYPFPNSFVGTFKIGATVSLKGELLNNANIPQILNDGTLIYPYIIDAYGGIGNNAYGGTGITRVIISDGITSIGKDAFASCPYLKKIYIPKSVTTIGDGAFDKVFGTTGITEIYYEGNFGEWINLNRPTYDSEGVQTGYDTGIPLSATLHYNQPMYKYVNTK